MNIEISGIVAQRDQKPYVMVLVDGEKVAQLSIAEARKIAGDIVQMAARTEADAMIHQFFATNGFPKEAGVALMKLFRQFRQGLDAEVVDQFESDPETGERV